MKYGHLVKLLKLMLEEGALEFEDEELGRQARAAMEADRGEPTIPAEEVYRKVAENEVNRKVAENESESERRVRIVRETAERVAESISEVNDKLAPADTFPQEGDKVVVTFEATYQSPAQTGWVELRADSYDGDTRDFRLPEDATVTPAGPVCCAPGTRTSFRLPEGDPEPTGSAREPAGDPMSHREAPRCGDVGPNVSEEGRPTCWVVAGVRHLWHRAHPSWGGLIWRTTTRGQSWQSRQGGPEWQTRRQD